MSLYFEGFAEARESVRNMSEKELYAQIDALYGRDNLPENPTLDELRFEALEQTRRDFRNAADPGWDRINFHVGAIKAMKRDGLL